MSEPGDENQTWALALIAAVVLAVVIGVIGLAASRIVGERPAHNAPVAAAVDNVAVERIVFEPGASALMPEAVERLVRFAEAARLEGRRVVVTPIVPPDAPAAAELVLQRVQEIGHALQANGVAPGQVVVQPAQTAQTAQTAPTVSGDSHRVDLTLE